MKTQPVQLEPLQWVRGSAHIDDGWIVMRAKDAETYWPMSQTGLAFELAGATSPDRIVPLVARWGLLRQGAPGGELRESLSEWKSIALTFQALMFTYSLLQGASEGNAEALEALRARRDDLATQFERPAADDEELKYQAANWIAWTVTAGLHGSGLGLNAGVGYRDPEGNRFAADEFLFDVRAGDLVDYAFYEAATIMNRSTPVRRCELCGRVFEFTHRRQRYCDEKCAGRARYRRWAERKKTEKGTADK